MTCPHCQHRFSLTWSRYVGAPLSRHICPSCGGRSRIRITLWYVVLVVSVFPLSLAALVGIIFALTGQNLRDIVFGTEVRPILLIFLAGFITMLFDRFCQEKFRKLEKMPAQ